MKKLLVVLTLVFLSGCSHLPIATAAIKQKQETARAVADLFFDRQVKQLCNYPTIGSIERRYGQRPIKLRQYQDYCNHSQGDVANAP